MGRKIELTEDDGVVIVAWIIKHIYEDIDFDDEDFLKRLDQLPPDDEKKWTINRVLFRLGKLQARLIGDFKDKTKEKHLSELRVYIKELLDDESRNKCLSMKRVRRMRENEL